MRAVNWPTFWRGYRRGVVRAYAVAVAFGLAWLLSVWLLAGCATSPRWDDPEALTSAQKIQYEAGAGLLTLVQAVNATTARVDGLAVDGVLTREEYSDFIVLRLRFRAWFQPVYKLYQAGGDVSGEAGAFYAWQAEFLDALLRLKAKERR